MNLKKSLEYESPQSFARCKEHGGVVGQVYTREIILIQFRLLVMCMCSLFGLKYIPLRRSITGLELQLQNPNWAQIFTTLYTSLIKPKKRMLDDIYYFKKVQFVRDAHDGFMHFHRKTIVATEQSSIIDI